MDPGLAAAAYTVETAIEGAAAGAFAIARSTVPLKARFYRLPSPSPTLKRSSHTLNVIRGRAYIFGGDGDAVGSGGDNAVHIVTLPTDLELRDTDYQRIPPRAKPSKPVADEERDTENTTPLGPEGGESSKNVPAARSGHCASVIGERIYVFGGSSSRSTADPRVASNPPLEENGKVFVFDTISKTWEMLVPSKEGCKDGTPLPRNYPSSSCTTHPLPIRSEGNGGTGKDQLMTEEAKLRLMSSREGEDLAATDDQHTKGYGTLFIHGGYDSEGNLRRDVWAFDVASRTWSRWPDVPTSDVEADEGNILCAASRLWRCGDGFGKVAHLDIVRDQFDDVSGKGELGVNPRNGNWEVHSFGVKPGYEELEIEVEKKMGGKPTTNKSLFPARRRRSSFLPVSTGQGRDYLLLVMGENGPGEPLDDLWSFQIASEKKSAAAFKDAVRGMIGKGTGMEQWAKVDVSETNKEEGVVDFPKGLSRFGSSSSDDWVGSIVIWGGIGPRGENSTEIELRPSLEIARTSTEEKVEKGIWMLGQAGYRAANNGGRQVTFSLHG